MIPRPADFAPRFRRVPAALLAAMVLAACSRDRAAMPRPPQDGDTAVGVADAPMGDAPDADSLAATVPVFEFVEAGGPGVVTVLAAASDSTLADRNQGAELLGTVGPLAFVRTWQWGFACGAHGDMAAAFAVLDLTTGRPAPLLDDSARSALELAYRDRALELFKADTAFGGEPPDSLWLTLAAPRYRTGAERLTLDWQLSGSSCYACSDNAWSSYTRSVRLPSGDTLPALLHAVAAIPLEVRTAFRIEPPDSAAGWSEIVMAAARRDALARLFGVTAPAGGREFLVWRRTRGGFHSAWLRGRGVEATIVGRAEGAWVAGGGRAWNWRSRMVSVPTTPCSRQTGLEEQ